MIPCRGDLGSVAVTVTFFLSHGFIESLEPCRHSGSGFLFQGHGRHAESRSTGPFFFFVVVEVETLTSALSRCWSSCPRRCAVWIGSLSSSLGVTTRAASPQWRRADHLWRRLQCRLKGLITGSFFGRRGAPSNITRRHAHRDLVLTDSSFSLVGVQKKWIFFHVYFRCL